MPEYYFDLYDDKTSIADEAVTLPHDYTATQRAAAEARQMAAETVKRGFLNGNHRIEVRNEAGDIIDSVSFAEAVRITCGS